MIPSNIGRKHILEALGEIDSKGIPPMRKSKEFHLLFRGKHYPPKYTLSLANKYANGKELSPGVFSGGVESNSFLQSLGFRIVELSGKNVLPESYREGKTEHRASHHNERCKECKKTIRRMLKNIYGQVEENYNFEVGTSPDYFKDTPYFQTLKEIYQRLQDHRGYEHFVKVRTLPRCDFFIPNPGFILEFDESQHFTRPREIALRGYQEDLKLGFDRNKWIQRCTSLIKKDKDPPYRDEQRAWYDTIRDILPIIKNLNPTVRLYSKELQYCCLNPEKQEDILRFQKLIGHKARNPERNVDKGTWVATVLLQSNSRFGHTDNYNRERALGAILDEIDRKTKGDGVVLFAGGYFNSGKKRANTLFNTIIESVKKKLKEINKNIIICLGIDGEMGKDYPKDQIAIGVSKNGILAIGRKFYPTKEEKKQIHLAQSPQALELGYPRIFSLNGKRFFLAVCYDIFGIKQKKLANPRVDVVLNTIHQFTPRCECEGDICKCGAASGDVYFAKNGLAGASKQWSCSVFGSVVFFKRNIPHKWPSGVYWNKGSKSTQRWKYKDNPIEPKAIFGVNVEEGISSVRIYNLN